jgi:hypothetical protein
LMKVRGCCQTALRNAFGLLEPGSTLSFRLA